MLADSFIVPFDREDIIGLNAELDDLTDFIEEAGRKLWLYRVAPTPAMRELAEVVSKQCGVLARGMPLIEDKKRSCGARALWPAKSAPWKTRVTASATRRRPACTTA